MRFLQVVSISHLLVLSVKHVCSLIGQPLIAVVRIFPEGNSLSVWPWTADPTLAVNSVGELGIDVILSEDVHAQARRECLCCREDVDGVLYVILLGLCPDIAKTQQVLRLVVESKGHVLIIDDFPADPWPSCYDFDVDSSVES
jgi:hypothetical protein